MSARGREGTVFSGCCPDQQPGAVAETEDFSAVRLQVTRAAGYYRVRTQISGWGGNQIAQYWIKKGNRGGDQPTAQDHFKEAAAPHWRNAPVRSRHAAGIIHSDAFGSERSLNL